MNASTKALAVIMLNVKTRKMLRETDPKAFEQASRALHFEYPGYGDYDFLAMFGEYDDTCDTCGTVCPGKACCDACAENEVKP